MGREPIWRGEAGYEAARCAATWRANKPERYPAAIMLAQSEADVIRAVRLARERGLQVTTRSGGHNWNAAHVRDEVMLVDLSGWQGLEVDAASRRAWVRPAMKG